MKFLMIIFALAFSFSVAAETNGLATIKMGDTSEHNQRIVKEAIGHFLKACPGFNKYWGDVESAHVEVVKGHELDYRREQFGWKNYLLLTVQVKQDTNFIPMEYRVFGHTLRFYAGGGNRSGIMTQKLQSQHFCGGFQLNDNGDAFLFAPVMIILDKLQ